MRPAVVPVTLTEKPLNIRLPFDIATELEALTKATGRTKNFLTVEALRESLQVQAWQVQDIKGDRGDAGRGEFVTAYEVATFFAKFGC